MSGDGCKYQFTEGTGGNALKLKISPEELDLDKTFDCGQCFRWTKSGRVWTGIVNGEVYRMLQDGDEILIDKGIEYSEIIKDYFDLDTDYKPLTMGTAMYEFEREIVEKSKGLRVLKQDQFETFISFIISQRKNISAIKSAIHTLCVIGGSIIQGTRNGEVVRLGLGYSFPSPEALEKMTYKELESCGLGYRIEYVHEAAKRYRDEKGSFENLDKTWNSTATVIEFLKESRGVGDKVANCVALFGCHRLEAFPIDVWIQRIIDTLYCGVNFDVSRFGKLAGVMQQFMFYSLRGKV